MEGNVGEKNGIGGKRAFSHGQSGPTRLFASAGAPRRPPIAWVWAALAGGVFRQIRRKVRSWGAEWSVFCLPAPKKWPGGHPGGASGDALTGAGVMGSWTLEKGSLE